MIVSILFYVFFLIVTLVCFAVFCVVFALTVFFDKKRVSIHWLSGLWTKIYFGMIPGWKVRTEGLGNIKKDTPYVVIVNHRSMLDIVLMYVLPLNFKWVAKKEVYKWPFFGWVMRMHGDIGIERGASGGVAKMMKEGGKWLSQGVSIVIFPEGTRSGRDGVGKFRDGAFVLAKRAGVGILPCVASGTDTAIRGRRLNMRNVYKVKVLPPVSAEEVESCDTRELASKMHELISAGYAEFMGKA